MTLGFFSSISWFFLPPWVGIFLFHQSGFSLPSETRPYGTVPASDTFPSALDTFPSESDTFPFWMKIMIWIFLFHQSGFFSAISRDIILPSVGVFFCHQKQGRIRHGFCIGYFPFWIGYFPFSKIITIGIFLFHQLGFFSAIRNEALRHDFWIGYFPFCIGYFPSCIGYFPFCIEYFPFCIRYFPFLE